MTKEQYEFHKTYSGKDKQWQRSADRSRDSADKFMGDHTDTPKTSLRGRTL